MSFRMRVRRSAVRRQLYLVCSCFNLDFHIVTKPAVLFRPVQSPFHSRRFRLRAAMSALKPALPRLRLGVCLRRLPAVVVQTTSNRFSSRMRSVLPGGNLLDGPADGVNLQVAAQSASALRLAVALVDRVDAVEDLAVHSRAQQLQVLGVRPHQRHRRAGRLAQLQARARACPPRPTPAPASSGRRWQSAHRS